MDDDDTDAFWCCHAGTICIAVIVDSLWRLYAVPSTLNTMHRTGLIKYATSQRLSDRTKSAAQYKVLKRHCLITCNDSAEAVLFSQTHLVNDMGNSSSKRKQTHDVRGSQQVSGCNNDDSEYPFKECKTLRGPILDCCT